VIVTAHRLRIDRDDNVWVTDIGCHRVFKFDPRGKLLLVLGSGTAGPGIEQFNKPTDVAFVPLAEVYVSNGYGNSRVVKFSPSGAPITSWGKAGKKPGEFRLPHSIVVDRRGRILVGDRENDRVQIFNDEGALLDIWTGIAPFGLAFDKVGDLYVADGRANTVSRLDASGTIRRSWGRKGKAPGEFEMPHMLAFDLAGNLLVAEINGMRLQKLVREPTSTPPARDSAR